MAYWEESESVYFDCVTAEMFEWWGDYNNASDDWSDEKWRSEFEKTLAEKSFAQEVDTAARQELERFLSWRREDKLHSEEEEKEWWEDLFQEINETSKDNEKAQRKAKQVPQVLEWIEEYQTKRKTLEVEKSADNYKEMLNVCFNLMYNWGLVGCLDEFAGLIHFTEETAVEFFEAEKTVESLYYLVLFYTDSKLLWEVNELGWKKKQLLKGTDYVALFHKYMQNEESAERYIFCYVQLEMNCKSGEELEQLDYASMAYAKARELSIQFPTEKILEQLKLAKMSMTSFYQLHDLEKLAEQVNKEYEQFLLQLRAGTATQKNAEERVLKWSEAIDFAEKYSLRAERNDRKVQPYTSFIIEVLKKLAVEGMQNDLIYMVAALYNLTELTDCRIEDIAEEFGADIANLVNEAKRQENENLLKQLDRCLYRFDTFRENLFANIFLATKICEKKLCNSQESFDAAQAEEFETYIDRYHRYGWNAAEKMGRELLELMHAPNSDRA